ncbi:MAG: hypothetical protein H7Y17_03020, partial [Chlorobia bacterium]|nr:hypothetical protein [Fimbriimonadaceae bacterium]
YMLPCGSGAGESERTARIACDTLGRFHLEFANGGQIEDDQIALGQDLVRAFSIADRRVQERWPFSRGFTSQKGLWRNSKATEMQLHELRELGVESSIIGLVETAGQAWNLIELNRRAKMPTAQKYQ